VDYLVVDEAHLYKNLAISARIPGGASTGYKRASDLAMKLDWLRDRHGRRAATFSTAPPIANGIAEIYVMQRYLQPDALAAAGAEHFETWAANFGTTMTALGLTPDASSYRLQARFARFVNVPDLQKLFRQVADVRGRDELVLAVPDIAGGKPETVVGQGPEELRDYVQRLAARVETVRNRAVRPEEDKVLKISGDGRKAALDMRLLGLPAEDGGKVAAVADRIARIYEQHASRGYQTPPERRRQRSRPQRRAPARVLRPRHPNDHSRWSVYGQLRAELVARGVPGGKFASCTKQTTTWKRPDSSPLPVPGGVGAGRQHGEDGGRHECAGASGRLAPPGLPVAPR
jgi:hypothetical protein